MSVDGGKNDWLHHWSGKLAQRLRRKFTDSQRFVLLCVVSGLICGLAAVGFHLAIHHLFDFVWEVARHGGVWFWVAMPLIPALGGLITGILMVKFAPNARGSGIPQAKAAYYNKFGIIPLRDGVARFFLGVISIGSGMSLGREGPTVHLCAAISSKIGQLFHLAKPRIQAMVPVGVGAGIASAFNTPISAIFFVFEEVLGDFSSKALGGILLAVVIAAVVSRGILGANPAFELEPYAFGSHIWLIISPVIGLLAAVLGEIFVRWLLGLRGKLKESPLPVWVQPAFGGLAVGIIGVSVFALTAGNHHGIFSIGYHDLSGALAGKIALGFLVLLLVGKFAATLLAYAFGGSGGLFAPVLFIGGMLGGVIGALFSLVIDFEESILGAAALLGMGAFFAAVIRCPITSILIIFEMTLNYQLILPLMVGNMLAYYLAVRWRPVPLYNALLLQDKVTLRKMPSYQGSRDWRNLPISTIMTHDVVTLKGWISPRENWESIQENRHHSYPVRDEERHILGMVTHHEFEEMLKNAEAQNRPMTSFLPENPMLITVSPDQSIREAARLMVQEDIMQVPVVSRKKEGRLLGILTLHDIARQQYAIEDQIGR